MTTLCSTGGVDQLALLADRSIQPPDSGVHHWLIRVIISDSGQIEMGLHPLEGIADHPADVLLGFVAPDDWHAIGFAATGRAHRIDDPDGDEPWRSLVVAVVDRSGSSACTIRRIGSTGPPDVSQADGPILDLCRRAIGLPTAPAEGQPLDYWARSWLDSLFRAAVADPARCWTWADAVVHHPMHHLVSSSGGSEAEYRFAGAVEAVSGEVDWGQLRQAEAESPDGWLAAWMDDGCYARWLLDEHLEPRQQLDDLEFLLPTRVHDRLTGVLTVWGVLHDRPRAPTTVDSDPCQTHLPRNHHRSRGGGDC